MSEARLLWLVARYPHRAALARRVRDGSVFDGLRRLEARGCLRRQRDQYRLTRAGRDELALTLALLRLVAAQRPLSLRRGASAASSP
jgi:DNA-binding PadR family transcriptional regulator